MNADPTRDDLTRRDLTSPDLTSPDLTSPDPITAVEVHAVTGERPPHAPDGNQPQANALGFYPEHRPTYAPDAPPEPGATVTMYYLRIAAASGAEGFYGPIDREITFVILEQLRPFLLGENALAGTIVWDKLERSNRHGRHGQFKIAISAIDNTLWDLRGRVYGAPVWQLLGGASRNRIPAYASMLGTVLDDDVVLERAAAIAAEGFLGQKWFMANGPETGAAGLRANVRVAEKVREAIGPDEPMMFDAYGGWDLAFARSWVERAADVHPTWLEEPFTPNRYQAFVELHRSTGIPLATGEHLYDRAELLPYLTDGVLAVVQADPEWCGGVTELVRICALTETFGVPVIPHGHGLHAALHVVASQSPATCPKVEYLMRVMPNRHHFELNPPAPVGGSFALPQKPGFGIELDESKITERHLVSFS